MTKLRVQNIVKSFNNQAILTGVTFAAAKGDVIALLGSSGSGKSTLLRCINLLTLPDSGLVCLDNLSMSFKADTEHGITTKQMAELRKHVGMVFQQFNLWAHMSVLENLIEAPLRVLKQSRSDTMEEANSLLKKVGLLAKANHYPSQLSGGQQQRAAIARALMMKPDVMLFDEPTSALDPEMVNEVLNVMQGLAQDGMTMIVATHELGFAKRVATQTIFLNNGKIEAQGATATMFANPTSERFRHFLEAMQH